MLIIKTNAVIVQTKTVSINGSNKATNPSEAAYLVFTAECAIEAEPIPASLENAARLNPWIKTPNTPPVIPAPVKAPDQILPKDAGLIITESGIGEGSKVIDAGTGTGWMVSFLSNVVGTKGKVVTYEKSKANHIGNESLLGLIYQSSYFSY